MNHKMYSYIKENHMIETNDLVVLGLSGGPDSICLFHMLLNIQQKIPFRMGVVHVNHMLRKEAKEEADFVEKLCKQHHITCRIVTVDVKKLAKEKKISIEEAGRMARYEAFHTMAEDMQRMDTEKRKIKIAIAHNKNDCAETVLFHLFRGTGMQGLAGILPVNEEIIRPLLCFERSEIEQYLDKHKHAFCCDASNEEDEYTRNRIRHHVLPFAEENVCENVVSHISETAEMMKDAQDFILQTVRESLKEVTINTQNNTNEINKKKFKSLHIAVQTELLREVLFSVTGKKKDITKAHIFDLQKLFDKQVGKYLMLPYQVQAMRSYDGIIIEKKKEKEDFFSPIELKEGEVEIPNLGKMKIEIFKMDKLIQVPEKKYTKWFDYDKIIKCFMLRTRMQDDFLTINTSESKKTLKEYMVNEKIPRNERDKKLVVADGNHIAWVIGYRISQTYKVTAETKKIIKIEITMEN